MSANWESPGAHFFSNLRWVCTGAAGVAFVVLYHKWYSRKIMKEVFSRDLVLPSYRLMEKWGLDYGSSMADNYFHGYLELVLPAGLSDHQGFAGRVKEYKRDQNLEHDMSSRMFVIVHRSGYSPDSYQNELPERFYIRGAKMEMSMWRNGIRKRTYQSSVYKISSADKKEEVSVVMEGAPCLRQMYESAKVNEAVRAMSDDIIRTFIAQLQKKIDESAQCQRMCKLIYFDDGPGAATTGKDRYHQLADELIQCIKDEKQNGL